MNFRNLVKLALLGTVAPIALSGVLSTGASAATTHNGTSNGPVTEAGETIGLALGAALPQGLYFVDTASVVHQSGNAGNKGVVADVFVNIPVVAWSTPWDVLGGHVEAYAALPEAALVERTSSNTTLGTNGLYNPALLIGAAWALPYNLHFSNFVGGYAPVGGQAGFAGANATNHVWTFNERFSLTYLNDGWNATMNGIYGTSTKDTNAQDVQAGGAGLACNVGNCQRADYLNLDFNLLKSIGKWDVGPVGYYNTSLSETSDFLGGARTIALGGFAGYNFGGISAQAYITTSVGNNSYNTFNNEDTRVFLRFIVPLGIGGK